MPIPDTDDTSKIIKTEVENYKKTGKIGNTTPRDLKHAQEIAAAIAYRKKRGGGRHKDDTTD